MRRPILLTFITLGLLFGWALRQTQLSSSAKMRTPAAVAGSQLDPNSFTSLGAFPTLAAGQYYINTSKDNANPTLLQNDQTTVISTGVFYDPTPGDATNRDEIAVFTYNSVTIPVGVNISGLWVANSRPVALLAQGNITINGSVDVSAQDGQLPITWNNQSGAGGAAGPGGGGGGAGGIGHGEDDEIPPGFGNSGGVGLVAGGNSGTPSDQDQGGDGGSVGPNGGGRGSSDNQGGGGAFGGNGGTPFGFGSGAGGSAYGDLALQLQGGSGGGGGGVSDYGGVGGGGGGGAVALGATGALQLAGQIRANGGGTSTLVSTESSGGGAGGGILLYGQTVIFSGSASVSATGGFAPNNAGGGGGRIRIVANTITEGCISVSGGPGMGPEFAGVYTVVGTVTPLPPRLAFEQQPTGTIANAALNPAITVRVLDKCGNLATTSTATITLALNNANGATLSGNTAVAVNGIATFPNLKVSKPGTGYTLTASSNGLTSTISNSFNISCQTITALVSGGEAICPTGTTAVKVDVSGGTAPYTVTLSNGSSQTGTAQQTQFTFNVSAAGTYTLQSGSDASGCPLSGSGSATVDHYLATSIQTPPQPQTKTVGQSATFSVVATGLGLSYQWRKNGQPILNAAQSSYTIPSVTFADQGSYDVVVMGLCGMPTSQAVQLTVNCQTINVSAPGVNTGTTGSLFSQSFTQANGVGTTNFSTASPLPAGLSLAANGLLSGTPLQAGSFPLTVVATDSNNCTGQTNYTLTINCATLALAGLPSGTAGSPYTAQLQASPAGGNYQFSSADKPAWLTLTGTGALSGTPPAAGTFSFNVTVTGFGNCTQTFPVTLTVNCPALMLAGIPAATAGSAYAAQLQASPAGGNYQFSSADKPAWLTLTSTGALNGTPPTAGTFSFSVSVTGFGNCPQVFPVTLTVNCPALTPAGLPAATAGSAYAAQLQASPAGGNYQFSSADKPAWLTLTSAGALSGTPLATGTFSFNVTVTGFGNCTQTFPVTLTVNCPALTLLPATLPSGNIGTPYPAQTFSVAPAGTNYSVALTGGQLPPGLQFNNGVLSGTPTAGGAFSFTVTATGWGSCTKSQTYTLTIIAICPAITLNPANLPGGSVGLAYASQTFSASGGDGPYSYAVTGGALPGGLMLNPAGSLSGTPTASGTFSFTVTVTGAAGCTGSRSYTLSVGCAALNWTPASLPNAQAGVAYSATIQASGAMSYSVLTGNLPSGLTLNGATGELRGTVTTPGTYSFTLQAIAPGGCSGTQPYTLTVVCPAIAVNPASVPDGSTGTAYSQTLSATPSGNYSFAKTSGTLPPGLSLSAAGVLSGTPTTAGTYTFTVTATGFGTCTGARQYTLTISANCAAITLPALPTTGTVNVNYSGNLAATTPSASYTFSVASGTLPPGLVIDNLFAQLRGKPTAAGTFNFTLKATRSNGCTGTKEYTLTISGGALVALARTADYDGDGKADLSLWTGANGRWQILRSSDEQATQAAWGGAGDVSLLGDYDGDGQSDLAVFRPGNGTWYILKSGQSSDGAALVKAWGAATDVPVPGDYDGDGKTDVAVWRPAEGNWYVLKSSDGSYLIKAWGLGRAPYLDVPVPGDYDGDGITDLAVFRRSSGTWLIQRSTDGQFTSKVWGVAADVPVVGDYDGDGKADAAVWRGATGEWLVLRSGDGGYEVTVWGAASVGDVPAPGDYDGDGKADWAVWRPAAGQWYVRLSVDSRTSTQAQGRVGDMPVAAR